MVNVPWDHEHDMPDGLWDYTFERIMDAIHEGKSLDDALKMRISFYSPEYDIMKKEVSDYMYNAKGL